MLAILRRRWFMVALSSAAFLIAIDYLSVGLGGFGVADGPLFLSSFGLGFGWILLASSVLIAQRRLRLETSGFILDYRRDRHFTGMIAVGAGLIALGMRADSTILVTQFRLARFVLLGCVAAGYALIAVAVLTLARAMSHEEQIGRSRPRRPAPRSSNG